MNHYLINLDKNHQQILMWYKLFIPGSKFLRKTIQRKLLKMNVDILHRRSRVCQLDAKQMEYVYQLARIVCEPKSQNIPTQMSRILDHLYLGSYEDAINVEALRAAGITHIVNTVATNYENCRTGPQFYGDEFAYYGFTSEDEMRYPIMRHFDETYEFIESCRQSDGKCLIHCMAGVNRSGSLAVAYVMLLKGMGPLSATQLVFDSRGFLLTNDGFKERVVKLAAERGLLEKDEELLETLKNGGARK